MNAKVMIELFGYLGSALVVVSMLMTSVVRLRVINTIGSVIFAIYALIIKSYPTALMNFFLVGINVYHLLRLRNTSVHYDLVETNTQDGYWKYLLDSYKEDILRYFPHLPESSILGHQAWVICCDHVAAGMAAGTKGSGNSLKLELDYSTPVYRDCSVGTFLYGELAKKGVKELLVENPTQEHRAYLEKMGFSKGEDGLFHKKL